MDISILIPAASCVSLLEQTVAQIVDYLTEKVNRSFEIVLIPNGIDERVSTQIYRESLRLATVYPQVRVCDSRAIRGKGAALKAGFGASSGEWIFFTDADLPYEPTFFLQALEKFEQGAAFVTGNRRMPNSRFNVPVTTLKLAYRRHRLGLCFNWMVRSLFPISTRDTQAGIKGMTRELAAIAFAKQSCPGFLFDIDIFLVAQNHGFRHFQLPVCLHLESEKSTVRLLRESYQTVVWLSRIWSQQRHGWYSSDLRSSGALLSRFAEPV